MLDVHGHVCELPGFNVFLVKDKTLHTPAHDILVGVTRDTVIEMAAELGYAVQEGVYELYHAYSADEIFLTSTAGGLMPVDRARRAPHRRRQAGTRVSRR